MAKLRDFRGDSWIPESMNWRFSLYGLIILPFIVLLSYGFEFFGLWFAIAAHFAYDAVLFTAIVMENRAKKTKHESRKIATFEG